MFYSFTYPLPLEHKQFGCSPETGVQEHCLDREYKQLACLVASWLHRFTRALEEYSKSAFLVINKANTVFHLHCLNMPWEPSKYGILVLCVTAFGLHFSFKMMERSQDACKGGKKKDCMRLWWMTLDHLDFWLMLHGKKLCICTIYCNILMQFGNKDKANIINNVKTM